MADIFELFKRIAKKEPPRSLKPRFIIAGLGNPGEKYHNTRHNIGWAAMDYISQRDGFKIDRLKFKALTAIWDFNLESVLFLKPQTYMNDSGSSIREAADFYKIPAENIIVIFDDVSLAPGCVRIRAKGSDGGHNGIKSVIEHLGSSNFPRIKIGVGARPHSDYELADWVLSKFNENEAKEIFARLQDVYQALKMMIKGEIQNAMSVYNKRSQEKETD